MISIRKAGFLYRTLNQNLKKKKSESVDQKFYVMFLTRRKIKFRLFKEFFKSNFEF